jgi:hypothetical protein
MRTNYLAFLILLGLSSFQLQAQTVAPQRVCGTEVPSQQWEEEFQNLMRQSFPNQASKQNTPLYTIPVIIHVIHGGQAVGTYPNLAQAQLVSQIKVLNNDFGGIGYNNGNYTVTAFSNWAVNENLPANSLDAAGRVKIANCNVQFCLATKDTNGNVLAEPGIERINYTTRSGWVNPASINSFNAFKNYIDGTVKAQTVWDVTKYMNIWVSDENLNAVGGLLGYATFPPNSSLSGINAGFAGTASTDGYFCYARCFGSNDIFPGGTYMNGYTKGRTSTHEIGHYLGLRHVWGDGNCATDYCDDTPPASASNNGNPSYPFKVNSCSINADGEMFMNFMDYTNDDAKYMYTADQALRIQTAMANSPYRKFLGTHNLCSVKEFSAVAAFSAPLSVCGTSTAIVLSNQSSGTPVPNYTWAVSGGGFLFPDAFSPVTTAQFPAAGVYTITLTADNGTVSVMQKTVTVYTPTIGVTGVSALECSGKDVTITVSGGLYYNWIPTIGSTTNTVSFPVFGNTQYSIVAFSAGGCKTSTVITIEETNCSGINENSKAVASIGILPNPAQDRISLRLPGDAGVVTISDVAGKIIRVVDVSQGSQSNELDIVDLNPGWYLLKWQGTKSGSANKSFIKN